MCFILWLVMTNSIRVHVVQSYADRRDCGRSFNPSARGRWRSDTDRFPIEYERIPTDFFLEHNIKIYHNWSEDYIMKTGCKKTFIIYIYIYVHHHLFEIRNHQLLEILLQQIVGEKSWNQKNMSCQNVSSHFAWDTYKRRTEKQLLLRRN